MCYRKQNLLYNMESLGKLTRHHRRPQSRGGKNVEENISHVPEKLHMAWHLLFANNSPVRIAEIINQHFLDPDVLLIPVNKEFIDIIYKILKNEKVIR